MTRPARVTAGVSAEGATLHGTIYELNVLLQYKEWRLRHDGEKRLHGGYGGT